MIVKLQQSASSYPDLTPGQPYAVIGIEADELRILNDQGRPYLYSPDLLARCWAAEPADWEIEIGDDGERYAYPAQFNRAGFFEDFFDEKREAIATFWRVMNQHLAMATL